MDLENRLNFVFTFRHNFVAKNKYWIEKLWDDCFDYFNRGEIDWSPVLKIFDDIGLGSTVSTGSSTKDRELVSKRIAQFHRYFNGKGSLFSVEYSPQMDSNYGSLMFRLDSEWISRWQSGLYTRVEVFLVLNTLSIKLPKSIFFNFLFIKILK